MSAQRPEDILAERGRSLVKATKAKEEAAQSRKLDIQEVLALLTKKVKLGSPMPDRFVGPPWRLPADAHPRAADVNAVLDLSIQAQSGKIDGSGDFEEFIASNSSLAVAGLVRYVDAYERLARSLSIYLLTIMPNHPNYI